MAMLLDDLLEDEDEVEVLCPLDGREAKVQLRFYNGDRERVAVVRCSRFGDEAVACGQPCMRD